MSEVLNKIKAIKKKVKNGKLKIQKKDIKAQILKDVKTTSKERKDICKKAREKAHTVTADVKREMSNQVRKHLNTLSEGYDFIEESFGTGYPEFTFYDEPKTSKAISESFGSNGNYGMIGVAEGVFAPIGVMSRNNRIYDEDHYDYLLDNELLKSKIANRGMLGTIGHHDKRVDDADLASGAVSHIVTDLKIVEEADGSRNLYGRLEIMDTPAGHLLKTYYEHGVPLYVSSRGAGKLLNVANESYKRVDKTNYFLETFDIVKDPGFLQAKPNYVKESLETVEEFKVSSIIHKSIAEEELAIAEYEKRSAKCKEHNNEDMAKMFAELADDEKVHSAQLKEALKVLGLDDTNAELQGKIEAEDMLGNIKEDNNIIGENNMDNEKVIPAVDTKMSAEEIISKMLAPLQEQIAELTDTVKLLSEKVIDEEKEEVTEEAVKEEPVVESKVEETKEEVTEEKAEDKEEEKAEDKKEEVTEEKAEDKKEEKEEKAEEVTEEKAEDKEEEKEETKEVDEAKAEETEVVAEGCTCGQCDACKAKKETEDDESEKKADVAESVEETVAEEKTEEIKEEATAGIEPKKETEDDESEKKADVAESVEEEKVEEPVVEGCDAEEKEKKEAEEQKEEAEAVKDDEEELKESKDLEAKLQESEAVVNDLVKMVSEASERTKELANKYAEAMKQLNAYKLSEELAITIEEAKERLESKTYEEIKEEFANAEVKAEEKIEETKEEAKSEEPIKESKKAIKPVFSRFGNLNESKKSDKKGFSVFG